MASGDGWEEVPIEPTPKMALKSPQEQQIHDIFGKLADYANPGVLKKEMADNKGPDQFLHGFTSGFGEKLKAGMNNVSDPRLKEYLNAHPNETANAALKNLYEKNLNSVNQEEAQYSQENPISSGVTRFAGAMMSPVNKLFSVGKVAQSVPYVGKLLSPAIGGAAVGTVTAQGESKPGEDVDYGTAAALGAGAGVAGEMIAPVIGSVTSKLLQKPREFAESVLYKPSGESRAATSFFPKERMNPTGSKLTEELKQKSSSFGDKLEGTGLNPDMSLGEVWEDPQLKENFLKSVQKVMSSRKRDAYSIPIKDIEEGIGNRISSDESTLM